MIDKVLAETSLNNDITVVPMLENDCKQLLDLFSKCFSHPWSLQSIEDMFSHPGYINLLARQGDKIIGYAGILAAADEADITNVAVDPDYRRRQVAYQLLQSLLERAENEQIRFIYLEVRQSNSAAVKLYEKAGFKQEGIRKNYYDNPREDAIIMKASISDKGKKPMSEIEPLAPRTQERS